MNTQYIYRLSTIVRIRAVIFFGVAACCFSLAGCQDEAAAPPAAVVEDIRFVQPANFPAPHYNVTANPVTTEGFELGRALFYDGRLSRDGSISCGSCHLQAAAFTHHGHDVSHGIDDRLGNRNAPPVMNMAWQPVFMWDGGVHNLDMFPVAPIENPIEMDEKLANVLEKLRATPMYPPLFRRAFGSEEITTERLLKAMSQFMVMCVSSASRYDSFVRGEGGQLTEQELQGRELFSQKCASCHSGELFTDFSFRNNGVSTAKSKDKGRSIITLNAEDDYKFKVPSLRNIAVTAPYMHDGRFYTLDEVMDHYAGGVNDLPTLDPLLRSGAQRGIALTAGEKQLIITFLQTLTDDTFLRDKKLAAQ